MENSDPLGEVTARRAHGRRVDHEDPDALLARLRDVPPTATRTRHDIAVLLGDLGVGLMRAGHPDRARRCLTSRDEQSATASASRV